MPNNWEDQTPRSSPPRISLGFGIGLGGGGHSYGHDAGRRMVLTPGVSVPLSKENSRRTVTEVTACWKTEALKTADVSQCDLEVNLARMEPDKISLTTLVLAMGYHADEKKDDPPPDEEKKTAKNLIREIDFTQKGLAKTKQLDV